MMFEQKRLHPIAILFNLIVIIKNTLFITIAAFLGISVSYFFLIGIIGFILFIIVFSFLSWYRFIYWIENDELRIEYGIFVRKKRMISKNRIQSIDLTANLIHRLLGLVKVQVETAGSNEGAEASLSAVHLTEAEQLKSILKEQSLSSDIAEEVEQQNQVQEKISPQRLFMAGTTSSSIGVLLAIVAFGFSKVEQFLPEHLYENTVALIISFSLSMIIVLAILFFFILWLIGIAGTMLKYWNFTIVKQGKELLIQRGLLETKQLTIPLNRIQAIEIEQSLIRQPLGYVSLHVVVAGSDVKEGFPVVFPFMRMVEVESFLLRFLPDYTGMLVPLKPLPKRALKFYIFRALIPMIILSILIWYFLPNFLWVIILLNMLGIGIGYLRYKDSGYRIQGKKVTWCKRLIGKTIVLVYHRRIQAFEEKQFKVQAWQKLATARLSIIGSLGAGTHYILKDLEEADVEEIGDWYSYREN